MLNSKFWQAFFALAPILIGIFAIIFYFFFIFNLVTTIETGGANGNVSASLILGNMAWFFAFIGLTIIISISSMVFYIVHAVQNPNLKENNLLIVWVLLFVLVSGIGQLVYWIVEVIGKRKNLSS